MATAQRADAETVGRVAYVDPSRQWGYLYGPVGERVYFHATGVRGAVAELELGTEVDYQVASGTDQLCAVQVVRHTRRDR